MPLRTMLIAVVIARSVRFLGEGYLAVHYGNNAATYMMGHKVGFAGGTLISILALYLAFWLVFRRPKQEDESAA